MRTRFMMAAACVIVAVFETDHGWRLEHGAIDVVHARLLVRIETEAMADELARKIRQVLADVIVAALEDFRAAHGRARVAELRAERQERAVREHAAAAPCGIADPAGR